MAIDKNVLIKAKVAHKRLVPSENGFVYNQHYVALNADTCKAQLPLLFSLGRWNLFSFQPRKYGDRDSNSPHKYMRNLLKTHDFPKDLIQDIFVITQPAFLGWSFNPVSFWFFFDKDGNLRAVLNEVNNTFGEHQKYFAFHDDFRVIKDDETLSARKVFYVSPFFKVEGSYTFRYKITLKSVAVWINYFVDNDLVFTSSLIGQKKPLTNLSLILSALQIPFANLKTVFLIHWQALKIYLKKIKYVPRKAHKSKEVERCR